MGGWLRTSIAALCIGAAIASPCLAAGPSREARPGIAWQVAASDAEVDRAFLLARQRGKPVFLYWGAVWCPPCNQVKATLFPRADFVERSRAFIPVYVDGDKPGAQKVAARFKVSGYPTMVLFKPDGTEITRLPGEVDPERYLLALSSGLNAQVAVKDLAQRALSRQELTSEQWQMLSLYSWDTDDQQVFKKSELAARLSDLAAAAPAQAAAARDRLSFKAVAARVESEGEAIDERTRASDLISVERVLGSPKSVTEQWDLVVFLAEPVVKYLAPATEARVALAQKWDAALEQLLSSGALSRSHFADALEARVTLWKMMDKSEQLSAERMKRVHADVMRLVAQSSDRYERQALVPSAAHVLASAGLSAESDAMLLAELPRAVAPYYHMLVLASNAKNRGDNAEALKWYEEAWRKSEGPATRIQWGSGYVRELVKLSPADTNRISAATTAILRSLPGKGETFFGRNQRSLERMADQLAKWQDSSPSRAGVVAKARKQLSQTCARLPAGDSGRKNCESIFMPRST